MTEVTTFPKLYQQMGSFKRHEITIIDQGRVNMVTPQLAKRSENATNVFIVLAAWTQTVHGENNYYWLIGTDNHVYSLNLFSGNGISIIRPYITYFSQGLTPPTEEVKVDKAFIEELKSLRIYTPHDLSLGDIELVNQITPDLHAQLCEPKAIYVPLRAWRMIIPGVVFQYYWLQSSTLKEYSVNVSVPRNGSSPSVTSWHSGFTEPNNLLLKQNAKGEIPFGPGPVRIYHQHVITILDLDFVRQHRDELREATGEKNAHFTPMAVWRTTNLDKTIYWLTTLSGETFTVTFILNNGQFVIDSCIRGLIFPTAIDTLQANLLKKQSLLEKKVYVSRFPTKSDQLQISQLYQQMKEESGDPYFVGTIIQIWENISQPQADRYYWLISEKLKRYTARVSTIFNLRHNIVFLESFVLGWINPNNEINH